MGYLLGIDLGTSSLKAMLISEDGVLAGLASRSYQFASPHSDYAEQDPQEWWEACIATVREVLAKSGISGDAVTALSFSGQMHGLVALDQNHQVVRPAILHCDARSAHQVEEIKSRFGTEGVQQLMMNPVYTGFLLPSLLWIRDNEPENFQRIAYVMLPKDYLKFKMTGEVSTDYSDASATLAFDIRKNCWSREILNRTGLPLSMFPKCYGTTEVVGRVSSSAAQELGLSTGVLVVAGGGDQVMQGIGNGITRAGDACSNIGTSGQISFQTDEPVLNPALNTNTFCGHKPGRWFTMGAIMNAGLAYRWYNHLFGKVDLDAMNEAIETVRPGSGGLLFLPYLNGERTPHLNPNISGAFMGLNLNTGRVEMARAVMEGVTYALNQCIEVCGQLGLTAETMIASGGATRSRPWLQIQADVFNIPLRVTDTEEHASLGAAIAAGVGAGIYQDIEEGCRSVVRYRGPLIEPNLQAHEIYKDYYGLFKEMYRKSSSVIEEITALGRSNGS